MCIFRDSLAVPALLRFPPKLGPVGFSVAGHQNQPATALLPFFTA
jgi:hypothetical protein